MAVPNDAPSTTKNATHSALAVADELVMIGFSISPARSSYAPSCSVLAAIAHSVGRDLGRAVCSFSRSLKPARYGVVYDI